MLHLYATIQTMFLGAKDRLTSEERGATAVEYALMVGLIAVVLIAGLTVFGPQLSNFFSGLGTKLNIT